jgi:hypothetical protein
MARSFFDQIHTATDPVAAIRSLVGSTPPTYETDWLDFKQQPNTNLKDSKWRDMWIEALTGFANNQGAVIIWGLDARKDPATNVDAACGEKPVDNPNGVKSRLIELQRQATDPPLGNVEIEAYEIPSAPGTGFVVCFVPEGSFKPYRAEDGRRSQYYLRTGDNFIVMSRSVLQAMFYPRVKAVFRAKASLSWELLDKQPPGRDIARMCCYVDLVNDGIATACQTLVLVRHTIKDNIEEVRITSDHWASYMTPLGKEFEASRPMHPTREARLFYAEWQVRAHSSSSTFQVVPACQAPSFELTIFCENQERQVIKIEFDTAELITNRRCLREAKPLG